MIRLFELRSEKSISQRDIARQFNISQATYNNWENGRTQPSIEQLKMLAAFYGVSVDYLIGNSDDSGVINYEGSALTSDEQFVLETFRALPSDAKEGLVKLLKNLK